MRAMKAREDDQAFHLFDRLCRYTGETPPGLMPTARRLRDFLAPDRTPGQKAETLFGFFTPTCIRTREAGHGTHEPPSTAVGLTHEP